MGKREFCQKCGAENPEGSKFCVTCGALMTKKNPICSKCGFENPEGSKFCVACGTSMLEEVTDKEPVPVLKKSVPICKKCGAKNVEGNKYCIVCGTLMSDEEKTIAETPPVTPVPGPTPSSGSGNPYVEERVFTPPEPPVYPEKSKSKAPVFLIVLIIVLLLMIGGVGVAIMMILGIIPNPLKDGLSGIVPGFAQECTCEVACTEDDSNEDCKVCKKDWEKCEGKPEKESECSCTEQCTEDNTNEDCKVCKKDWEKCEGAPICSLPPSKCTCTEQCTEDTVDEDCEVCSENWRACEGKIKEESKICTCTDKCTSDNVNSSCEACSDDYTSCQGTERELTCTCADKCTADSVNYGCEACAKDYINCKGTVSAAKQFDNFIKAQRYMFGIKNQVEEEFAYLTYDDGYWYERIDKYCDVYLNYMINDFDGDYEDELLMIKSTDNYDLEFEIYEAGESEVKCAAVVNLMNNSCGIKLDALYKGKSRVFYFPYSGRVAFGAEAGLTMDVNGKGNVLRYSTFYYDENSGIQVITDISSENTTQTNFVAALKNEGYPSNISFKKMLSGVSDGKIITENYKSRNTSVLTILSTRDGKINASKLKSGAEICVGKVRVDATQDAQLRDKDAIFWNR